MERKIINPAKWQDAFGFVQGQQVTGAQSVLFCAGQVSIDPEGKLLHVGDYRGQLNCVLDNIEKVLHAVGVTFDNVYEIRTVIGNATDFGALNDIFRERMPNRGFVGHGYVTEFLASGMKIEVEAEAYLPEFDS